MVKNKKTYNVGMFKINLPQTVFDITTVCKGDKIIGIVGDSIKGKFEPSIIKSKNSNLTDSLGFTPTLEQAINVIIDEAEFRGY